jgi:hypothetical protein
MTDEAGQLRTLFKHYSRFYVHKLRELNWNTNDGLDKHVEKSMRFTSIYSFKLEYIQSNTDQK